MKPATQLSAERRLVSLDARKIWGGTASTAGGRLIG